MNSLKFRPQLETMDERIVPDATPTVTIPDAEQMLLKDSTMLVDLEAQTQSAADSLAAAQSRGDADGIAYWSQNFANTATAWAGVREDYTGLLGEYQVSAYDVPLQISDFHPDVLDAVPGATAAVANVQVGVVPVVAPQAPPGLPANPKDWTTAQLDAEIARLDALRKNKEAELKGARAAFDAAKKEYDALSKVWNDAGRRPTKGRGGVGGPRA